MLRKVTIVFGVLIVLGIIIRAILPSALTALVNRQGSKQSPHFAIHINDIDFHILKGNYVVKGITGFMKSDGKQFFNIEKTITSVPWENIFQGEPVASVLVDRLHLTASDALLEKAKAESERVKQLLAEQKKKDPEDEGKKKESPISIQAFRLTNSDVTIQDFMEFKGEEKRQVTDINMLVTNLTPTASNQVSNINLRANIFGPAPLQTIGTVRINDVPPSWDMNTEMKNFDLPSLNPFIRDKLQAFIHKGKLNMYTEAVSIDGTINGYVKPFVSKMKMDTPPGGFQFKGAAAATGGNLVKALLTDSEAKTLATEVPFEFDGNDKKLSYEIMPALEKAVVHKAKQNIPEGFNDNLGEQGLGMKKDETMQAEEAK